MGVFLKYMVLHSHDQISICMLKICGKTICKPQECIYRECLNTALFPLEWKKASLVLVYKTSDKQCFKKYRPVSLLPICDKTFEKLHYLKNLSYFMKII